MLVLDIIEFIAIIYAMVWLWKQAWVKKTIYFFLEAIGDEYERELWWGE